MNPIIVVSHDPAAGQNWWERTQVNPRSHQMHARGNAHSKSPGGTSRFFRWPSFSRRQAVGVVAYLNTGTLTAITNSFGALKALRSLFSHALSYVRQDRERSVSKYRPVLFVRGVHVGQRSEKGMSWVASVVSRVTKCL